MSFMQLEIISFLFPLFEIDSMCKRSTGRREICRIQRPPVLPGAVHCTPSSGEILHLTRGTVATSVGVPSGGRRGLAPFQEYGKPWTGTRNFSKSRWNFLTGKYGPAPEEWGERGVKVAPIDHHTGPQSSFADRPLWHCHIRCNASPRLLAEWIYHSFGGLFWWASVKWRILNSFLISLDEQKPFRVCALTVAKIGWIHISMNRELQIFQIFTGTKITDKKLFFKKKNPIRQSQK